MKLFVAGLSLLLTASCPVPKPPVPKPTPTPVITPTPVPTPTPTPVTCVIPDTGATSVSPRPTSQFTDVVNSTMQELYGGDVQSRVVIPEDINTSLDKVVNALKAKGICAGIQSGADEVCILETPGTCQGYHVFVCGNDCSKGTVGWASGSVRDTWVGPVVVPSPTPVPTPNPTPTPITTNCPSSVDKITVNVRDQAAFIVDATPQTCNKDWCNANGFTGRNCCPLGVEGSSDRPFCENLFGPYTWTFQGIACPLPYCFNNNGNPLQERILKPTTGGLVTVKSNSGTLGSGTVPGSN